MKILLLEMDKKTNLNKVYELAHKEKVTDIIINGHDLFNNSIKELIDIFPNDNINTYLIIDSSDNRKFRIRDYQLVKEKLNNIKVINSSSFEIDNLIIYNEVSEEDLFSNMNRYKIFLNTGTSFKYEYTNKNIFVSIGNELFLIDYEDGFNKCFRMNFDGSKINLL